MIMCFCYPITEEELKRQVEMHDTEESFALSQRAGTKCGGCEVDKDFLREFYRAHKKVINPS